MKASGGGGHFYNDMLKEVHLLDMRDFQPAIKVNGVDVKLGTEQIVPMVQ